MKHIEGELTFEYLKGAFGSGFFIDRSSLNTWIKVFLYDRKNKRCGDKDNYTDWYEGKYRITIERIDE